MRLGQLGPSLFFVLQVWMPRAAREGVYVVKQMVLTANNQTRKCRDELIPQGRDCD